MPPSTHLPYYLDAAHPLAPALLGRDMLCSLPKPSRQGSTFPPSTRPLEPGSPPEPTGRVRSQASRLGWSKAAGHSLPLLGLIQAGQVPGLGSPTHPFPVPLSLASQHKPCQSTPSPAQRTPALHRLCPSPDKPHIKPGSLTTRKKQPLAAFPTP